MCPSCVHPEVGSASGEAPLLKNIGRYAWFKKLCCTPYGVDLADLSMFLDANTYVEGRSTEAVREGALAGNREDCLEMGLRVHTECAAAGTAGEAMDWWWKVAIGGRSDLPVDSTHDALLAKAFSCLAHEYFGPCWDISDSSLDMNAIYRAAHYANQSVKLGLISANTIAIATQLRKWQEHVEHMPKVDTAISLYGFSSQHLKHLWKALDDYNKRYRKETQRYEAKIARQPSAYRCAAAGCGVEATSKSGLRQCAGTCPPEYRPSYCSRECQREDWSRHKPVCKGKVVPSDVPTVVDEEAVPPSDLFMPRDIGTPDKQYVIRAPLADGTCIKLSSSNMSPEIMKMLRDAIQQSAREDPGHKRDLHQLVLASCGNGIVEGQGELQPPQMDV